MGSFVSAIFLSLIFFALKFSGVFLTKNPKHTFFKLAPLAALVSPFGFEGLFFIKRHLGRIDFDKPTNEHELYIFKDAMLSEANINLPMTYI